MGESTQPKDGLLGFSLGEELPFDGVSFARNDLRELITGNVHLTCDDDAGNEVVLRERREASKEVILARQLRREPLDRVE